MTVTDSQPTLKDGRVVAIAGPVIDVEFPPDAVPQINTMLAFDITIDGKPNPVRAEVAQQIGDAACGPSASSRPTAWCAAPRSRTPATACRCRSATPCSATW